MIRTLERYFEFDRLGTNWRTEILAGATTFVTMAYIIFVNPSILHEAGMPFKAVMAATCFCAAFGSILMGAFARYPIALAPGMGLNAYFAYTVVKGMGIPWQAALGAVFLSGVAFLLLTVLGIRQLIVEAIPRRALFGRRRGHRTVHRHDRPAQRRDHRGESGYAGRARQSARSEYSCSRSSACCSSPRCSRAAFAAPC